MKTTLFIKPIDLQRAVAFCAGDDNRFALRNVQIDYAPMVSDDANYGLKFGKSKLRATDSFRMIEVETDISTEDSKDMEAGTWYIERLDALSALAEARIKKAPFAICEVNDEVNNFPKVDHLWGKDSVGLEKVSFSSKLLADSIKALKCQNVRLEFAGNNERALILPDNKRIRALIMPIRSDDDL